ncbi:MAG: hypothetical protein Q9169_008556 [Polycauliona sp. 2 TL-2023]
MEAAGLAVGVIGLTGTFTACVECFEYVQFGLEFGQDFGKCLLKMDVARLRISRWGAAMGFNMKSHLGQQISASDAEIRVAQSLLEQILEIFEDAERMSEQYKKHAPVKKDESNSMLIDTANPDADLSYQRLHLTMRELAIQRQKGTSFRKKAAWAFYERKKFERMIEDVRVLTDQLIELFPRAQDDQRALCKTEVSAIDETKDLVLLEDVASEGDIMLSTEAKVEIENRGHHVTDFEARGSSRLWVGDDNAFGVDSRGHNFARFTVSDNANVHLGNVNKGQWSES